MSEKMGGVETGKNKTCKFHPNRWDKVTGDNDGGWWYPLKGRGIVKGCVRVSIEQGCTHSPH